MNIIEKMCEIITNAPNISDFSSGVDVDYTEQTPGNFGLYSTGDSIAKRYIDGGELHQHNFILYACNQTYTNYDRLNNSSFLLDLSNYLNRLGEIEIDDGVIQEISCANGMMFSVPSGDIQNGCTYQLQIQTLYYVKGR